ncbi:MAG TPA: hypothetical protein PLZ10_08630 [Chitinophagaceae bacterium]|jgi:uncharacterized membrane protein (UPF0136 family)|nr:hypothetical protein [Chitinophagaceae bacterium]
MNPQPEKDAVASRAIRKSRRMITAILATVLVLLAYVIYKATN